MIGRDKISEKPVSLAEVLSILKARKKDGELGFEQQAAFEYAEKFAKISGKKAEEFREKLEKLSYIPADMITKIIDLSPTSVSDLHTIYSKGRFNLTEAQVKEVLGIVEQYK